MACYLNDNVYTNTFTPREYQVELLEAAKEKNIIVCSSSSPAKMFIVVKLIQELSKEIRTAFGKKALILLGNQNIPFVKSYIELLTDLKVLTVTSVKDFELEKVDPGLRTNQIHVFISTAEFAVALLTTNACDLGMFNLLVIDDCLSEKQQEFIKSIMLHYNCMEPKRPRILGLTTGLLGPDLQSERLEAEFQRLEHLLSSQVDTSSEIVTMLRLSCRPRERLVECTKHKYTSFEQRIYEQVQNAIDFLADHRFDPSEIYEDDLLEEFKQVPDPKDIPLEILKDFLNILEDLGIWAANRVALSLLSRIEKLKVKVPYERHYLLLCTTSTVLVRIRAECSEEFDDLSEPDKIYMYSAPKVLRFLEVLKCFKPPGEKPVLQEKPHDTPAETVIIQRGKNKANRVPRRHYVQRTFSDDISCVLVFTNNGYTAKILYSLLYILSQNDDDFWWVSPLYSTDKIADPLKETKEAELEYKREEDVLRRFRSHECNVMISTSILETDCDLPKCNLVIRFDLPETFLSYIQCKARARASEPHYILLVNEDETLPFVEKLAEYNEVEKTLLRRCRSLEPSKYEEMVADSYHCCPYQPLSEAESPYVGLNNSIALVNRYCAKLPSDTFTKLTPIWQEYLTEEGHVCSLRLPINSPLKQVITSPPMKNYLLARRTAAFLVCKLLHKTGELDDNLQPIGKENFKASEDDWNDFPLEEADEILTNDDEEPRPGTTKRRQYYYKRIADSFLNCHPVANQYSYFYKIEMTLTCPLPEEQNTRGRKIYPPEESAQGFGILTSKEVPKLSTFPIFTRSGEVSVNVQLCSKEILLTKDQIMKIREFLNYTFTSVLRLQKYLMLFDPDSSDNAYLIVPTISDAKNRTSIDWDFINLIFNNLNYLPDFVPNEERIDYKFDPEKYRDAVVMPWYRNQDQPQYFYVAEICGNLNPSSAFPGSEYSTFAEYYQRKYGIQIQNAEQSLLDVDHTSARLNFLTPRYVNRKGVALPTSSEETKKAKRENLEQKQILVPELCAVHPFPASLWRKAVCLPCILYRVNGLLLADQIRKTVSIELGLGKDHLAEDFEWPTLNFGWSLSDVLKKNKEDANKKSATPEVLKEVKSAPKGDKIVPVQTNVKEAVQTNLKEAVQTNLKEADSSGSQEDSENKDWIEIGTWSNDMVGEVADNAFIRYASPTTWLSDDLYEDFSDSCYSDESDSDDFGGLRIEFTGDNVAEALGDETSHTEDYSLIDNPIVWNSNYESAAAEKLKREFRDACVQTKEYILSSEILIGKSQAFRRFSRNNPRNTEHLNLKTTVLDHSLLYVVPLTSARTAQCQTKCKDSLDRGVLEFSFDFQPNLEEHPGPSPSVLLQALTMSNANDGINLERLETIGDSFLKYAITNYLYAKYENVHEGKLSHLRSKQVSNLNLYRLGKRKNLGEYMIATKFDPHDNWLPPCFYVPKKLEQALIDAEFPSTCWTVADMAATRDMTIEEICSMVKERGENTVFPSIIPYNLVTQHSIPDKSIADCVEALIGAYLIECGPEGALKFMAWLGIRVLPKNTDGTFGKLELPKTPLIRNVPNPEEELDVLLDGYDQFETCIGYTFKDKSYMLQALTHASYFPNKLTDCYQRLEFLGDAVLDYIITRHLYEDSRMHSPGALTDLRSALVNNTIFASLAVRNGFHRYFRHLSPGLNEVIQKFIRKQEESGHSIMDELYLVAENEGEEVEDVEVPKALGDVFESVAGAIFLDSGMSLDAVWAVYYRMMQNEIEQFSNKVPKSPIRELLELEPETAKFSKPEKLTDGRRVRVAVEVFGKGIFKGIGRNYRIAKCTAAKCALKQLKRRELVRQTD